MNLEEVTDGNIPWGSSYSNITYFFQVSNPEFLLFAISFKHLQWRQQQDKVVLKTSVDMELIWAPNHCSTGTGSIL